MSAPTRDLTGKTAAVVCGLFAVAWAAPATAYRPFDGTDAAVADLGEVEIEFQPAGAWHTGEGRTLTGPNAVFNYGFMQGWELVLQGEAQAPPEGPTSVANGIFLKHVVHEGVLQDKSGPSIAVEFGPLLPDIGQSGLGFGFDSIVSQRWDWGTAHFNVATNLTPDQHGELFLDTIIEGPIKWKIRPVVELYADSIGGEAQTYSALLGAIWQVRDNLAFDVALRHASVNGQPVDELRAGVTFGFSLQAAKPERLETREGLPPGRR
jgi:hypothetical protein